MGDLLKWKPVPETHSECRYGNCFRTNLKHFSGLIGFSYKDTCPACDDLYKAVKKVLYQKNA